MTSISTTLEGAATVSSSAAGQQAQALPLPRDAVCLNTLLTLRDGVTVTARAIRANDTERLHAFHSRLSLETIYQRFFSLLRVLTPHMATSLTHVDYENRMALVATTGTGDDEQIVAVASYDRAGPTIAEVAFVVEDSWQGRGIATELLYRLAAYARSRGIVELLALTLGENLRMQKVLRQSGFPVSASPSGDMIEVRLDISQPPGPFPTRNSNRISDEVER